MTIRPSSRRVPTRRYPQLAAVQWLLIVSGTTLLLLYGALEIHAHIGRAQALAAFETTLTRVVDRPPDQSLWSPGRIAAYQASLGMAGDAPVGTLSIARLGLRVPVFNGTGELALNRGAGHIEGTASLTASIGNVGIAGHRDGFFRLLENIQVGDLVAVRFQGGERHYRVSELVIVDPHEVQVLDPTRIPSVTLVTCYPFYFVGAAPKRFIVKAVSDTAS